MAVAEREQLLVSEWVGVRVGVGDNVFVWLGRVQEEPERERVSPAERVIVWVLVCCEQLKLRVGEAVWEAVELREP